MAFQACKEFRVLFSDSGSKVAGLLGFSGFRIRFII